ncbi:MAG: hypothetical protein ACTSPR_06425 [Candidatus Thorarchaeota archaeon]
MTTLSGVLVILLYCVFTLISWAFYPEPFSPWANYLSRLGNFNHSPFGAYFYNLGCVFTGTVLVPFFLGLNKWYSKRPLGKILLISGQIVGILSAVALILIGVFSEDQGSPHMTASSTFFVLNFIVLILINVALLWHPKFLKVIAVYGFSVNALSLGFELAVGGPLVEWFTVFGSLGFVALLSYNTLSLDLHIEAVEK